MNWQLYMWTFRLKSPLHVGFHKIMHFFRTRPYIPGKLIWGVLTAKLTPLLSCDYQTVGEFLKKAMRFGYFYPYGDSEFYLPVYTEEGLKFGLLSQNEFDKRILSSMASAAIEAESLTAEEGMLHEVEFINPYTIDDAKPVLFKGLIWIRKISENEITFSIKNDELLIIYNKTRVEFKNELVNRLQIGGERKYGFGLIELKEFIEISNIEFSGLPGSWCEKDGEVYISINKEDAIWSHVLYSDNINIKGNIEPLVGRDWDTSKGAGRKLIPYGLCWVPGSILCEEKTFKIAEFGIWKSIK
ncbi:MAG: RAMP superfamily CRISPR-associated protein [Thermodesulfobacteriota bacterium]